MIWLHDMSRYRRASIWMSVEEIHKYMNTQTLHTQLAPGVTLRATSGRSLNSSRSSSYQLSYQDSQATCIHDFLIIHEMLRKKGKATQHNRKTKQHNTTRPRQYFSKKKAVSGGTRTHDRPLARRRSYQMSYRGNSAGWARITYTIQSNQSTSTKASQTR